MLTNYYTTALEEWVTNFYNRLKVVHPKQLKIEYIAKIYDLHIINKPCPSFYLVNGRFRSITLDSRESSEMQREMFFHEFAHILRHSGIQSMLPAAFQELQEWDARHFTLYAAIPHHMLKFVDFDDPYFINQMTSLFKVTPQLCEERIEQVNNRRLLKSGMI